MAVNLDCFKRVHQDKVVNINFAGRLKANIFIPFRFLIALEKLKSALAACHTYEAHSFVLPRFTYLLTCNHLEITTK